VLVAISEDTSVDRERTLLHVAADVARQRNGRVTIVQFDEVPDQAPLTHAAEVRSSADAAFERQTAELVAELDVPVEYGEAVSHDTKHAVVNYAERQGVDLIVTDRQSRGLHARLFGDDTSWILRHAPCDVVLVDGDFADIESVVLLTEDGPYDPVNVTVADALATAADATIRLRYAGRRSMTDDHRATLQRYHEEIASVCASPTQSDQFVPDGGSSMEPRARTPELPQAPFDQHTDAVVVGIDTPRVSLQDELASSVDVPADCASVLVHSSESKPGRVRRHLERWTF
jgi:nucleotide-binding universal stress UspA family protein